MSIEGFNSLETIDGTLSIYNNEQLLGMSLKGFAQLSTVGSLSVTYNDSLEHLDGLRALEIISGSLEVYSNWRLGSCKALAYVLKLGSVGGGISIRNNPSNCSSHSQILSSISPPSQPEIIEAVSVNRSPALKLTPSQSAEPLWPLTGYEAVCDGVTVRKSVQSGAMLSDNSPVTQRVTVSSEAVLSAIEVDVDISHSDPSDLVVTLTSPAGTEEVLWEQQATMGEDLLSLLVPVSRVSKTTLPGLPTTQWVRKPTSRIRRWSMAVGSCATPVDMAMPIIRTTLPMPVALVRTSH